MKTNELREKYLAFFETKGCVRRPSDVLVPRWDPSVLFTPAGMNQFKDHFLGRCKLDFTRATTCQKCLRQGDIENVGRTAYHHTFFEMLGNFSFGDYFKREAIHWAWEFLTDKKWLGLAPEKLSATVYLDDDEAAKIWTGEIGLPKERLSWLGEDENFWPANAPSQGPDGVCGPCSEIYYQTEHGEVEIWNLVFTQFNRVGPPPENLRDLPSQNIDTGMGLERTAAVLQGVETNFDIDILRPIVEAAAEACGVKYDPASDTGRRLRRIADHTRACTFSVHENVYPGPQKEKYVIRRLLRRAALDGRQIGREEPFLHTLVPVVAEMMKEPYPELSETITRVSQVIEMEESGFYKTIDTGLAKIDKVFEGMKAKNRGMVRGHDAFDMYQTYGFPPELFESLAAEHNYTFDWPGFHEEMRTHSESDPVERGPLFQQDPLEALKKAMHSTKFSGYESLTQEGAKIAGIVAGGKLVDKEDEVDCKTPISVVLDKSSFYGEKGGQVGDMGTLAGDNFRFEVIDTKIDGELIVHVGHLSEGEMQLGDKVTAVADADHRQAIARAHTATHLLHWALRKHLGEHAEQQGSKVDRDWLRFDFTNPKAVPSDVLEAIEDEVNTRILAGDDVDAELMSLTDARKTGAMMLFGEKYPDKVRVVRVGEHSAELCGGTHLQNASQVGLMKIIHEESVSAGTRRITALTGAEALKHLRQRDTVLSQTAAMLKVRPDEVPERVEAISKEVRQMKKELAAGPKSGDLSIEALIQKATKIGDVNVILSDVPNGNPNVMRQMIDQIRRKAAPAAIMLAAKQGEGKVMLIAGLTRDLVENGLSAVEWIGPAAKEVQGGGGGRPDMAQAGGKNPAGVEKAFDVAKQEIEKMLS